MAARNQALYGVDTPAQVIDKYKPGGVIYFDARRGPDNVREPAADRHPVQRAAGGRDPPAACRIPLLISTDQEGGAVVFRLTAPATAMPGNMALGAGRSTADAHRSAEVIGTELAAVGINQNYAPVADVNVNPANPVIGVRSVGEDPELVSDMVAAQVDGYHDGGVAAVAKHFPGHGDTAVDSHFGLPEVTHTRAQLEAIDLPPFRAAIAAGVDTIMTAHVVLRSVDPSGAPATMSRPDPHRAAARGARLRRAHRHRRARHGRGDRHVPAGRRAGRGVQGRRRPARAGAADGRRLRRGARRRAHAARSPSGGSTSRSTGSCA